MRERAVVVGRACGEGHLMLLILEVVERGTGGHLIEVVTVERSSEAGKGVEGVGRQEKRGGEATEGADLGCREEGDEKSSQQAGNPPADFGVCVVRALHVHILREKERVRERDCTYIRRL